jgi:hypothetical protein
VLSKEQSLALQVAAYAKMSMQEAISYDQRRIRLALEQAIHKQEINTLPFD